MKWIITALVVLQAPFLFIVFVMAGTDGKMQSLVSVWAFTIPLGLFGIATIVNVFRKRVWGPIEWGIAVIACVPTLIILVRWIAG